MLTIELGFPAGRYHATAWGRHVNEGVPEWPPSPYRLIRALYDAWKRKRPDWDEDRVQRLLRALASSEPLFHLPDATASHTRSFLSKNEIDLSGKTLIFDAFVALSRVSFVIMQWPRLSLSAEDDRDLRELLSMLNYLGRSESWVSCRVLDIPPVGNINCQPIETIPLEPGYEIARVAVATPETAYQPVKIGRGRNAAHLKWMDAISSGTDVMINAGWSEPPAMRYVDYWRRSDCFDSPITQTYSLADREVGSVLYELHCKPLPLITSTLDVAQSARNALMGCHKRIVGEDKISKKFSGKGPDGKPSVGHVHAFLLPLDRDRDGRIDHLLVRCAEPFVNGEVEALDGLQIIRRNVGDIRCVPVQWGGVPEVATEFESSTPFVPVRHYKGGLTFDDWLREEVARECANLRLPSPAKVVRLERISITSRNFRCSDFRRNRKSDPVRSGYSLRLEFEKEVIAPFAIGYGCHFGLGQFRSIVALP